MGFPGRGRTARTAKLVSASSGTGAVDRAAAWLVRPSGAPGWAPALPTGRESRAPGSVLGRPEGPYVSCEPAAGCVPVCSTWYVPVATAVPADG